MRSTRSLVFVVPIVACSAFAAAPARAQVTGFATDRFEPSERGSDWFANESLDLRGHGRWAIGVVGDLGYRPLVIYAPDGSARTTLIEYQLVAHPGVSLVLADRVRFAVSLPVAAYQTGEAGSLNGVAYSAPGTANVGDLRLGADVRLAGAYGSPITLAAGVQVWAPTGSRADYTGDGAARVQPRLTVAGDVGPLTYAVRGGFTFRGLDSTIAGTALGSEIAYGAALGLRAAERRLTIGPELFGTATVTDGDQLFKPRTSPIEALFGAHYRAGGVWNLGAGAGTGLSRGLGSPEVRVLAVIEWAPLPVEAPADRDHDGVLDADDACPDVPGVRTDDPKTNGCPPPAPPPPAPAPPPPPPDRDHDGVLDADDACPDVAGEKTSDPKTNGCPPDPDRDKDGVPNVEDACPDEPGQRTSDPKTNGCPAAVVRGAQIVILDQVKFATASAVILPASDAILQAVLKVLTEHPEIGKVSVEGHTDSRGGAAYNKNLSARRAAAVVKWLVDHGVDRARLASVGYGLEKPIDTNATEAGRQNNRRVEFHIVEGAAP